MILSIARTAGTGEGRSRRRASLGDTNLWEVWGIDPTAGGDDPNPSWWGFPGVNPPSSSGVPAWATVANTLTTDFTRIWGAVQPVPAGCTKARSANGQEYVSCSGSGIPPQPSALNFTGGASGGLGPLVLIGGAAVLGLLLFRGGKN